MPPAWLHRVFLYSFTICLFVAFVTIAAKAFPIANLPTSTNSIVLRTCLVNMICFFALLLGIIFELRSLVKVVKIFSLIQLGAVFLLICLYAMKGDVKLYDEKMQAHQHQHHQQQQQQRVQGQMEL